ncbi:MAG: hypothetical protein V4638_01575 [Bacteroidota bacterium]
MKNKRLAIILLSIPLLLLIPFFGMQFSDQVNWDLADFAIMFMLLLGVGLTIEFSLRALRSRLYRILFCIGILLTFLLIWMELAVGIFGTPFAGS